MAQGGEERGEIMRFPIQNRGGFIAVVITSAVSEARTRNHADFQVPDLLNNKMKSQHKSPLLVQVAALGSMGACTWIYEGWCPGVLSLGSPLSSYQAQALYGSLTEPPRPAVECSSSYSEGSYKEDRAKLMVPGAMAYRGLVCPGRTMRNSSSPCFGTAPQRGAGWGFPGLSQTKPQ